ncbi:MAG: glycosyltransferase family 9 protein [Acidimicrobiia bacterium]
MQDRPRRRGRDTPPTLVVLRALGHGDLLTAVPALRALTDAHPDHRLLLACPQWLEPIAQLTGAVHEIVPAAPLEPLPASVHGAALAVNLHGRGPESSALLARTRPSRLVAYEHPDVPSTAGSPRWRADEHEVHRWCRLLRETGVEADPTRLDLDPPPLSVPAVASGATVLHPGASAPARRWPLDRWAAVARAEQAKGHPVVLTGSPAERNIATRLAKLAVLPEEANMAGRTSVLDLVGVVAAAARVVSGDTGVAHLATALRTPSVVLFGPVPPSAWGPPRRPQHRVLWRRSRGDPHGTRPDPGLLAISVDDVLTELAYANRPAAA